eukprot:gene401-728_t
MRIVLLKFCGLLLFARATQSLHFSKAYHRKGIFGRTAMGCTSPKSEKQIAQEQMLTIFRNIILSTIPTTVRASSESADNIEFQKGILNVQSDDFWYPPYMLGVWNSTLTFSGAKFTNLISFEELSKNDNIPGFTPYSVIFAPNMGENVNLLLRFVELDSHPRQDHPYNIRQLIHAFLPDTIVDSAPYYFQKAPDWFRSPANKFTVTYHDPYGSGVINLLTKKRETKYFSGTIDTTELIEQIHYRKFLNDSKKPERTVGEYALHWKLSIPASLRNEFVPLEEFGNTQSLVGSLDIYSYIQPSNDLYMKIPGQPAAIFSYKVNMERMDNVSTSSLVYPFVWRDDGPRTYVIFLGLTCPAGQSNFFESQVSRRIDGSEVPSACNSV